ncbi:hypothetical protein SLE2022_020940 [Rubroshorea leprosula]
MVTTLLVLHNHFVSSIGVLFESCNDPGDIVARSVSGQNSIPPIRLLLRCPPWMRQRKTTKLKVEDLVLKVIHCILWRALLGWFRSPAVKDHNSHWTVKLLSLVSSCCDNVTHGNQRGL